MKRTMEIVVNNLFLLRKEENNQVTVIIKITSNEFEIENLVSFLQKKWLKFWVDK